MRREMTPGRRPVRVLSLRFGAALTLGTALSVGVLLGAGLAGAQPAAAAAAAAPAPSGPIRIAVASPSHIFNEMMETKSLQAKMQDDQKKFAATQREKAAAIDQLKAQRDALKPGEAQFEELNNKLIDASLEAKVWMEAERAKAEHQQKRQMKQIFEKIQTAIADVAKQDGYDLVLADNKDPLPSDADLEQVDIRALRGAILQKSVLFSTDRIDISQKVLALLDTRYKAAGGAAILPAPSTPGAGPGAIGVPGSVTPNK